MNVAFHLCVIILVHIELISMMDSLKGEILRELCDQQYLLILSQQKNYESTL